MRRNSVIRVPGIFDMNKILYEKKHSVLFSLAGSHFQSPGPRKIPSGPGKFLWGQENSFGARVPQFLAIVSPRNLW